MKKIHIVTLIIFAVVLAGLFYFIGYRTAYQHLSDAGTSAETQTFYATISDLQEYTVSVSGLAVNDINFRGDFRFTIEDETKLVWRYTEIALADLEIGDTIAVTFSGEILETEPAQLTQVEQIQVLDDEL